MCACQGCGWRLGVYATDCNEGQDSLKLVHSYHEFQGSNLGHQLEVYRGVFRVNLTQCKITRKGKLSEELSRLCWSVGKSKCGWSHIMCWAMMSRKECSKS